MGTFHCLFWICTLCTGALGKHSDNEFTEKSLVQYLQEKQADHQQGRPVADHRQPVDVAFGINLKQVLGVNEEKGQLITNIWTHYRWRDPSLAWNTTRFKVSVVRIPAENIWTPDVALFNYADYRRRLVRSTLAVVNSTGHIDWIPTGIFKSTCLIDTYPFPFDQQVCHMAFRSLSMGITAMTLKFVDGRQRMSLDSYVPNPEWKIIENSAIRSFKMENRGIDSTFYDLTFTLRLKRRSVFHRYVLVLPCVLLSLTSGVLFILPPESPAKIQIGIFIFQGFFLLLNLLKNSTPPSGSSNPIICFYYSTSMIATTIVMFACGFLVEIHFRAERRSPMSNRMRRLLIKRLARLLFIPIPPKSPREVKREVRAARSALREPSDIHHLLGFSNKERSKSIGRSLSIKSGHLVLCDPRKLARTVSEVVSIRRRQKSVQLDLTTPQEMLCDLVELRKIFQRVAQKQAHKDYVELVKLEWIIATIVFDRIFFMVYLAYIIWSLFLLLPQEDD